MTLANAQNIANAGIDTISNGIDTSIDTISGGIDTTITISKNFTKLS